MKDSSFVQAFRYGCELMARNQFVTVQGGEATWDTPHGSKDMGNNFEMVYDVTASDRIIGSHKIVQSYYTKSMTFVFFADSNCTTFNLSDSVVNVSKLKAPEWTSKIPQDAQYFYALGQSRQYFYEFSSWKEAEENAVMSLAKMQNVLAQALVKKNDETYSAIQDSKVDASLHNITIVGRWRDIPGENFYVLARIKK